jgi:RimJ/RimL family protein N-acetyltransferase
MQPCDFLEFHGPALETNEARHNIILAILARAVSDPDPNVRLWTLGTPGQCAVQTPGRPIVLGDLDQAQVILLAETTVDLDYPGVVGPDLTAKHFADRASTLGIDFLAPIPQRVHALSGAPRYPGAPGQARAVDAEDAALFADWMIAFTREAVPHDRLPEGERLAHAAREGQHLLWVVDGEPVSVAGIVRRTRHTAAIAAVYTPPHLRRRGYAGSVTAAVAELAFAQGKRTACLYTDLRNPFSNRCYAKIGFEPVCDSLHYPRAETTRLSAQ